jgi:hypothetical protein
MQMGFVRPEQLLKYHIHQPFKERTRQETVPQLLVKGRSMGVRIGIIPLDYQHGME